MSFAGILESPGNDQRWNQAVENAYQLNQIKVEVNEGPLIFTETKSLSGVKYISTAPFLSHGLGTLKKDFILSSKEIELIRKFVEDSGYEFALLKSAVKPASDATNFFLREEFFTFLFNLDGGNEKIMKRVPGKTRNQIRKSLKGDFRVCVGREEYLDPVFKILSRCWRDLGTPSHGKNVLREVLNNFKENEMWFHIIYDHNTPVSAALVFNTGTVVHHPWAGTIKEYKSTSVNNLLYWSIIQEGAKRGCKYFDMGRSAINKGTYSFKESWGTTKAPLYYIYIGKDGSFKYQDSALAEKMTSLWKFVPLSIANLMGPGLIKAVL